jgi:hypothetical protein
LSFKESAIPAVALKVNQIHVLLVLSLEPDFLFYREGWFIEASGMSVAQPCMCLLIPTLKAETVQTIPASLNGLSRRSGCKLLPDDGIVRTLLLLAPCLQFRDSCAAGAMPQQRHQYHRRSLWNGQAHTGALRRKQPGLLEGPLKRDNITGGARRRQLTREVRTIRCDAAQFMVQAAEAMKCGWPPGICQ